MDGGYKRQEWVKGRPNSRVWVVKEERGDKGSSLTTYLWLAGRYFVLMPNPARSGGIARKITVAADRKKLKEIAGELQVPEGMAASPAHESGPLVREAGEGAEG